MRTALLTVPLVVAALSIGTLPAAASVPQTARPAGSVTSAVQARSGTVTITGWAYDRTRPAASVTVCVWTRARCAKVVRASMASRTLDRSRKIAGRHGFRVVLRKGAAGSTVLLRMHDATRRRLDSATVSTPGARVIAIARKYVGRARYVEGGASPRGFDCSGYTRYAYQHGRVAMLPHNAQAQRHAPGMRRISRASARPGDLVFYLGGGYAYHVAIYAGHGRQYAAATPRDGIRYQRVWSSAVEYRTDWH